MVSVNIWNTKINYYETVIQLFANCFKSKTLWNSLKEFFKDTINTAECHICITND